MRLISQGGMLDYPYDNSLVFLNENSLSNDFYVKIQLCGAPEIEIIAKYSSREKAFKTMEMLRKSYENNEFWHCMATTDTFNELMATLSDEKFKKSN